MIIPNEAMLLLSVLAMAGTLWYGYHKKDYVVGIWWTISLLWMAVFFAILTFNLMPIADQAQTRVSLYRPANASLLAGIIVFSINGRLNGWIDKLLQRE